MQSSHTKRPISRLRRRLARNSFLLGTFAGALFLGSLSGVLLTARPDIAYAAMAVIDGSNLAKNAETAAQTAKHVAISKEQLENLMLLKKVVGIGMDAHKVFTASSAQGQVLGGIELIKNATPVVQDILGTSLGDDPGMINSVITPQLVETEGIDPAESREMERKRMRMLKELARTGISVGLGVSSRSSSSGIAVVKKLADLAIEAASEGGSLRGQQAVDTLASIAIAERLDTQNVLLAKMLAMQGLRIMNEVSSAEMGNPGITWKDPNEGSSLFE